MLPPGWARHQNRVTRAWTTHQKTPLGSHFSHQTGHGGPSSGSRSACSHFPVKTCAAVHPPASTPCKSRKQAHLWGKMHCCLSHFPSSASVCEITSGEWSVCENAVGENTFRMTQRMFCPADPYHSALLEFCNIIRFFIHIWRNMWLPPDHSPPTAEPRI